MCVIIMADRDIDALVIRILELESSCIEDFSCPQQTNATGTRQFVEDMKNVNTVQATESHCRLFTSWLAKKGETRKLEEIQPKELDVYLAQFTLSIRKEGNTSSSSDHPSRQYEPCSLAAMHYSFFRYLNSKNYGHNIKTSDLFKHSREVLKAKIKELKQLGKGNRPRAAEPFTPDEIALMYEKNILGIGNPKAIINTMWLNSTLHFGLRGRHEHVKMTWGDMELKTDDSGCEYVRFHDQATKTRQRSTRVVRAFAPRMYSTGNEQCPVQVYKEYARRRPSDCLEPDSRFYLIPHNEPTPQVWFTKQPMGKNTIGSIAKKMAIDAQLRSDNRTNHSGRKMAIQTLLHAGIPPKDVIQLTGHKNVQSLNAYAHLSIDQQRNISHLLTTKLPVSTVLSGDDEDVKPQLICTVTDNSSLNGKFEVDIGFDDNESIMEESCGDEVQHPFNEQECVTHLKKLLPLLPCTSGAHNSFLSGAIYGNITININTVPAKRRQLENDI